MIYRGRAVGCGLTEEGKPAVVYFVSGRSLASQCRRLLYYPEFDLVRVKCFIPGYVPMDKAVEIGQAQEKDRANIEYNAMRFLENKNGKPLVVASNGHQTDSIALNLLSQYAPHAMDNALSWWGVENDREHTPRIAGSLVGPFFNLSIIRGAGLDYISTFSGSLSERKKFRMISTYKGKEGVKDVVLPERNDDTLFQIELSGMDAQDIANELYEWLFRNSGPEGMSMDASPEELEKNFAVGTAAAVISHGEVYVAVRNKWK